MKGADERGNGAARVTRTAVPLEQQPTRVLVRELASEVGALARKELELARAELKNDLRTEARTAARLGIAAGCAFLGVNLLLVTAIFALALVMPGWLAALLVTVVVLAVGAIAGGVGWMRRVRQPLARTRRTLKEDVRWIRERTA
jgi:uncharacterized membrane protein YqjE